MIDDLRVGDPSDPRLDDVRTGWHAATLVTVAEAEALAAASAGWTWSGPATCRRTNDWGDRATA